MASSSTAVLCISDPYLVFASHIQPILLPTPFQNLSRLESSHCWKSVFARFGEEREIDGLGGCERVGRMGGEVVRVGGWGMAMEVRG